MIYRKAIYFILLSFLLFNFSSEQNANIWQLKKVENGISIYIRDSEKSKYKELKAVFQLKTSLSSVIALLNDVESYPQWVYRCQTSKILSKTSDKHMIRYQTVAAPWPVDNRDVVVEVNCYQDEKTKVVYQKVTALPNYAPKVVGHVRIPEFRATWTLIPLKNGIVEIQYELLVNPGGAIPAWLVNMAMIDGPYDTSLNMKTWLLKEKYQKTVYPFISNPD